MIVYVYETGSNKKFYYCYTEKQKGRVLSAVYWGKEVEDKYRGRYTGNPGDVVAVNTSIDGKTAVIAVELLTECPGPGYFFYNEVGNRVTVLHRYGDWLLVEDEEDPEPFVLSVEYVASIKEESESVMQTAETKGFKVYWSGDESVDIPDCSWEIEGPFNFNDDVEIAKAKYMLVECFNYIVGENVVVVTFEEIDKQNKLEQDAMEKQ